MDCDEETIEVLYNDAYGGYGLSDKAKKMFEERKTNEDFEDDRDTLLILQIFHELGIEFSDKFCQVKSEKIFNHSSVQLTVISVSIYTIWRCSQTINA
jgi:hypothetical protein